MLTTLAGSSALVRADSVSAQLPRARFARELINWIDRFNLDANAFVVDRTKIDSESGQYAVLPSALMREMPKVIKPLRLIQQLAAVVVLSLYNRADAQDVFKSKRLASMNPVGLDAFAVMRVEGGEETHSHLLRLLAAYRGW
jgi:hypothetical protein